MLIYDKETSTFVDKEVKSIVGYDKAGNYKGVVVSSDDNEDGSMYYYFIESMYLKDNISYENLEELCAEYPEVIFKPIFDE